MSRKKVVAILLVLAFVLSLAGCGGGSKPAESSKPAVSSAPAASSPAASSPAASKPAVSQPASNAKYVLKMGHVANTAQPYHEAAVEFSKWVKDRTKGEVDIQIFPNSQLGGQRDLLEGLQFGTLDMTLTSTAVLANFITQCQVIDLPFIFTSKQHVYKVVDGPIANDIYKGDEAKQMKVIGTWENGFRHITNNVRPINAPDDMKGIKIRVMENQLYIDMFKALGANPTPMAMGEVFTALQQKTVDAQENPIGQIYASRFYEVQKYLTLTGHTYSPETIVLSLATWKKLPKEYQDIIVKASDEARDWNRKRAAEMEGKFIDEMKAKGLQVAEPTPEQKVVFQNVMKPVYEKYYSIIGKDLIDKVINAK